MGSSFGGANIKGVYLKAMFLQFLLIAFGVLVSQGRSQTVIATVDSGNALAYGNSRKLVVDLAGVISLVFHASGEIFYTESHDNGSTWSIPANLSLNAGLSEFPALAVDSLGRRHIAWQDNTVPDHPDQFDDKIRIYYKNFIDTSEIAQRFAIPIGESVGNSLNPSITVDDDGRLYAAWSAYMGLNLGWEINFSEGAVIGQGLTGSYDWSYPEVPGEPLGIGSSFFPSVDAHQGVVYLAWLEENPFFQLVDLVKYREPAGWSRHFSLSDQAIGPYASSTAGIPSLIVDADTTAHAVFREVLRVQNNTFDDVFYLSYRIGDTLSFSQGENVSQSPGSSTNPVISLGADHNLYVVWQQKSANSTDIMVSARQADEWSPATNVSLSSETSAFPQMAVLDDDSLLVVWVEGEASPFAILARKIELPITGVSQASDDPELPSEFRLYQNYPNPFNPETEIKFQLAQDSYVTLSIFNVSGERIRTLVNEQKEAGYHRAIWDGRDESGRQVASGIYLYRIEATPSDNEARPFAAVSKMTLLR